MSQNIHQHRLLILDFGSQYAQLIARRVREIGVYCELMHPSVDAKTIRDFSPNGIILSGGPETVTSNETYRAPSVVFELGCPVLGICYGMQTMATQLGGKVEPSQQREFGFAQCEIDQENLFFQDVEDHINESGKPLIDVWMSHGDKVTKLPEGFKVIGVSKNCPIAAMANLEKQFYGLQFHPEVTHTKQGLRLLSHFVKNICQCETSWNAANILEDSITHIKQTVGDEQVLVALSGGVDSSVVAALMHRAIGDRLTCVFVDNGLLRKDEGDQVMRIFAQHLGVKVIRVNAQKDFLSKLEGIDDPEKKRKIIGNTFIKIFDQEAEKLQGIRFLGQGTIYPDVIESAAACSGASHVIKSHHNVGGLPEDMQFKLIEPLRELFKDEVRKLGLELGLPRDMVYRHPFPGPGLAVRILGEVKVAYADILREADAIFIEELRAHDLYDKVSQAFAVFLPVKSVGVKGDARCYEYVVALRAVTTTDFMTAEWAELPHAFLAKVSNRILNEVAHISRVVYDISGKPPATIEWE